MNLRVYCFINMLLFVVVKSDLPQCKNKIYCTGPILKYVAEVNIFEDSKTFVDMRLKKSPKEVFCDFKKVLKATNNNPSRNRMKKFVAKYFESAEELEQWTPTDFNPHPKFIENISNTTVKEFASKLVYIWPTLGRRIKDEAREYPDRHSLILLPNGFIVPGGRFREIYYWDTYWIVEGLLVSEMTETVKGILENFLNLIEKFGYIPNGNRIYYLDRSQPPFFTSMVYAYIKKTNDMLFLEKNIALIDAELMYWISNKTVQIQKNDNTYTLAQFISGNNEPRPESYAEDLKTCGIHLEKDRPKCYNEIKTGAETGWDFSSRWIFDKNGGAKANLSYIEPTRLVQVDLNVMLCKSFRIIKQFYHMLNKRRKALYWKTQELRWKTAIEEVLYNKEEGLWFDYDIKLKQHRKLFYLSNFSPLAGKILKHGVAKERGCFIAKYLKSNGLDMFLGGLPSSLEKETGLQWDQPNAWPPLQDDLITGLAVSKCPEAVELANKLVDTWMNSVITGFRTFGQMYEKYDVSAPGRRGGGGEYEVQTGFGWTNGATLKLINEFYTFNVNNKKRNKFLS